MGERATVTLQQGIWIDQQQLTDAGLQAPLEIAVQPGEIRIRSAVQEPGSGENASTEPGEANERKEVWDVFRSLGRNAQPGRLNDPSTGHDRFLYGASQ
jgi:hypothetical protein